MKSIKTYLKTLVLQGDFQEFILVMKEYMQFYPFNKDKFDKIERYLNDEKIINTNYILEYIEGLSFGYNHALKLSAKPEIFATATNLFMPLIFVGVGAKIGILKEFLNISKASKDSNEVSKTTVIDTLTSNIRRFFALHTFVSLTKIRKAKLLHTIPNFMAINQESLCKVRISHSEKEILKNLEEELQKYCEIKDIRVTPTMHVEVTDMKKVFEIHWLTAQTQFIDKEESEFTEWVFYATPCKTGTYSLFITVSAIIEANGKEHRKDKVFSRSIEITTLPTPEIANNFETLPNNFSDEPKEIIEDIVKLIEQAKIADAFNEIDNLPFTKDSTLEFLRKKFVTGKTDEFFIDMLVVYVRSLEGKFKE